MPGVVLGYQLGQDVSDLKREFGKLRKQLLQDVAAQWHLVILPKHFTASNRSRYQHQPRTSVYLKEIKPETGRGQGRFVDQMLGGKSRRFMMAFHKISGTQTQARLTMSPPPYFANPFIGETTSKDGRKIRVTQQPDKPSEITRLDNQDRDYLRRFAEVRMRNLVRGARSLKITKVDAK